MSQDPKFQQRWEFRSRENDFDSSSNDSESSSSGEPVFKKHRLVSNLMLPENDETSDTSRFQQKGKYSPGMGGHFKFGRSNKMRNGLRKKGNPVNNETERDSFKDVTRKKSKSSAYEPAALDDIKIFMKSILEELKVTRENMFTWMREEMHKLMADDTAPGPTRKEGRYGQEITRVQHQNCIESGMKTQNRNGGSSERPVKSKRTANSNNYYEVLEHRVDHGLANIGPMTSTEKDNGERLGLSVKPNFSSNPSDQGGSSMYLTLPTVLPEPRVENHRLDSPSCNYIQPGVAGNKTGMNSERANLMHDASFHRGYFSGMQPEEKIGSFAPMGSRNIGCFDQNSTPTSSIGTGFPVPLHQGLDGGFNISSQVGLENLSRECNNILGLRMNGGAISFSGASHALTENYVSNNFRSQLHYQADGGLMAFRTPDLKEGHLFPN